MISLLQTAVAPTSGGGDIMSSIVNLLVFGMIFASFFFGQQIQSRIAVLQLSGAVTKLEGMKNDAKRLALSTIREIGKPKSDPAPGLSGLLEQFIISPVDMDPAGIVPKLDHLLDVRDLKFKDDVKRIAPEATDAQVNNLSNLVEASWALNMLFKIVRHFYLLGKKTSSFYVILQLQMLLPMIMQEANAYVGAAKAFATGQPVGDGAGALVVSKLMKDKEKRTVAKDMLAAETTLEGRRIIALKAEGPGGNVGKPGDAIRNVVEENEGKVSMVVMVDAALKLEGEETGEISEGIGAAIGGIGTERFKIEAEATKMKIPVYAFVIKESIEEAVTPMKKSISDAAEKVMPKIVNLIKERTKEGELVIVAGIGNTVGIAQ